MLKIDSWEKPDNKISFLTPPHSIEFADSFVISVVEVTVQLMVCNSCKTTYTEMPTSGNLKSEDHLFCISPEYQQPTSPYPDPLISTI